ncbi:MAG: 4Fe-4S dicluster domain-containing protein [Chloroflexi bacterium]|nr:4Fe-4S dicluster domain-containing protein [Chloroflexota bacterium]MBI4197941.1 4Fe-4S dicluster domain-containing protein [Chloroflexota bacterium]
MVSTPRERKWQMVVDVDRCTGCQACVVACQAENNIPFNSESHFKQGRTFSWIRIERYWEGEFPDVKARFLPFLCQHCDNAPCEPVCPVFATYHNNEGLNVQVYNRCVGTRFCQNNCPYHARFFNYWEPVWPVQMRNSLNPDVTVRGRGIMEKCTFCVQRIRRAELDAKRQEREVRDGDFQPACAQACPTSALVFGDVKDPQSRIHEGLANKRRFRLREELGTEPNVVYLSKVDSEAKEAAGHA